MAQQIAFPTAEGAGKYATGGRGTPTSLTTVFEVTNLTDVNTIGSLRYACNQSTTTYPYRTIVFRVSGTIHLASRLNIPKNTTIAGQTAPGDGICIADYPVAINGDNVIVRYMRFRMGDKNQLKTTPANCGVPVAPFTAACMPLDGSGGDDALGDLGHKNLIIDHCTVSWSTDEALTFYRGDSLTLQWNMISEPLNYSYHFETGDTDFENHGYGGIWGSLHGTFHHNLIASCRNRSPRFSGNSTYPTGSVESADFRNNVLYNWGINNIYGGDGGRYNIVNNYYKYGPQTGGGVMYRIVGVDSSADFGYARYYLSGNYVDGSPTNTNNNWLGAAMNTGNVADTVKSKSATPFLTDYLPSTTDAATVAYDKVLADAGASLPRRDTLDRRIVSDVRYRVGKIIDVQGGYPHATPYAATVNAWPTLASTTAPADTDHDGMPDSWETANGSNPNDASDRGNIAANGYTLLENYLNNISLVSPEIYFSGLLSNFSQTSATPSTVQTVTVSGINLQGNVTITPPAGFEVSNNGGTNWYSNSSPLVIVPTAGAIASFTLSIRLNTATAGTIDANIISSTVGVGDFFLRVIGTRIVSAPVSPASATWTLLTNQVPTTTGSITAGNQTLAPSMVGIVYGSSFSSIAGWQRVATTSNLPVGYSAGTYLEYTMAPTDGRSLAVSSMTLSMLGGGTSGAQLAAYYSLNGFATSSTALGPITYNNLTVAGTTANPVTLINTSVALTGQQVATIPTSITVPPGQTLSIRLYPWAGSTGRYFTSQNVTINGTTAEVPLPISLVGFSASLENGQAKLYWKSTNEINLSKFEIESSVDGRSFSKVGEVGAKNNIAGSSYTFLDPKQIAGIHYYRLKMIDKDGSFKYSYIVAVSKQANTSISVYPNPVEDILTIRYASVAGNAVATIVDVAGKPLQSIKLVPGSSQTTVSAAHLLPGTYFINFSNNRHNETIKFMKQ